MLSDTKGGIKMSYSSKQLEELFAKKTIEQLEKGVVPWEKPWNIGARNWETGREYTGLINQLMLNPNSEYATFNQINKAGGKVKEGAKSTLIIFYANETYRTVFQRDKDNNILIDEEGNKKTKTVIDERFVQKYYNVFEIGRDTEGLELRWAEKAIPREFKPIEGFEKDVKTYLKEEGVKLIVGQEASYAYLSDIITMPKKRYFKSQEHYYDTLCHEMVHSTGNHNRLNRFTLVGGKEETAREELIAEIGATMLLSKYGVMDAVSKRTHIADDGNSQALFTNNVAYCQSWLMVLNNNKEEIYKAATGAAKAVRYYEKSLEKSKEQIVDINGTLAKPQTKRKTNNKELER